MNVMLFATLVIVALILLISIISQRYYNQKNNKPVRGDELPIWPFRTMPIMTDSEVLFFAKLQKAVPDYFVFSQVQLSRIIEPTDDAGTDRSFWFNRICRQSVDFVIIDNDAQTTLLAIELDDWTHEEQGRSKADIKKDKALASAGIPILRFHSERLPSVEILRHDIKAVLRQYPPNQLIKRKITI